MADRLRPRHQPGRGAYVAAARPDRPRLRLADATHGQGARLRAAYPARRACLTKSFNPLLILGIKKSSGDDVRCTPQFMRVPLPTSPPPPSPPPAPRPPMPTPMPPP